MKTKILDDSQYLLPNGVVTEEASDFSHGHGPEFIGGRNGIYYIYDRLVYICYLIPMVIGIGEVGEHPNTQRGDI